MKRLLINIFYVALIIGILFVGIRTYDGSSIFPDFIQRQGQDIPDESSAMDIQVQGRSIRNSQQHTVDLLADRWNKEERGFRIRGGHQLDQRTSQTRVYWDIIFYFDATVEARNDLEANINKKINDIIGEAIIATVQQLDPSSILVVQQDFVTIRNRPANPSGEKTGYFINRSCMQNIVTEYDVSGEMTWSTCAVPREGILDFTDVGPVRSVGP